MKKISVIMPIYNDAELLNRSINSFLKQTLDNMELICVNDGSSDNSLEILNNFSEKYDFIRVLSQENQGSGKARNHGINEAAGEYIAFLDADDFFIDENCFERLYDIALKNNADMVSGNIKLVDSEGNFSPFKFLEYYTQEKSIKPEEYGIPWSFYKNIYKKSFLMENNIYFPDLLRGQDPVFLAEVLSKLNKIYVVDSDVYAYYYINGAMKCNTSKKRYDHILHFRYIFDYLSNPKFDKVLKEFKQQLFAFIDMMGEDGAEDTLFAIRDVFCDDAQLVKKCEDYYYAKFMNNKSLLEKLNLNNRPKISVIVPVYNAESFLDESINSILNQSFHDFEVICVNNGSFDNSLEILNNFSKIDSRVKVINKENEGYGSARNSALNEAIGDYICFFDCYDYILPNTFEELYNNAVNNNSDLLIFKIAHFRDDGDIDYSVPGFKLEKKFKNKDFNNFTFKYKKIKRQMLNSSFVPWNKLYSRLFLNSYDDFCYDFESPFDDILFHIKSILRAKKISYVPDFFYYYRFSTDLTNNNLSNGMDIFKICDLIENFLKNEKYYCEFIHEFKLFKISQIFNYMFLADSEEYFQMAKKEFSKIPIGKYHKLKKYDFKRFKIVLNSNNFEEYKNKDYKLSIKELKNKNKKLKKKNKELTKENKNLKKKLKKVNKFNKSIKQSKSLNIFKFFTK